MVNPTCAAATAAAVEQVHQAYNLTNGCKCYHQLEIGCVITAWASCHNSSSVDGKVCKLKVKNPLIVTVQIYLATSLNIYRIGTNQDNEKGF